MSPIRRGPLALVLLAACALATSGCQVNPVTGSRQFNLLSLSDEVRLGDQNHPNIIFMYDGEYYDQELNRYLGTIVMRLHESSHRPEMPMEFTMLNTSVVNAFAIPAHVYATRGFLAQLKNEAQFAAVMGHELAHVAAGHSAQRLSQGLALSLLFGAAGSAAGESQLGRIALGVGEVGVTLLGLSYSREQERQADRVGTYYMALSGWHPRQAISMQELLASLSARQDNVLDRYLSTHPGAGDRVQEIESVISEKGIAERYIQGDGVFAERWQRRCERLHDVERAFGPYDRGMKALNQKQFTDALSAAGEALQMRDDQAPFHRLKGDALLGLGRVQEATSAYRDSLNVDPRYVLANIGLGRAYLAEGDNAAAEREFEKAALEFPGGVTAVAGLGIARFKQGKYAQAVQPLSAVAQSSAGRPDFHYMLAVSYDELGRPELAYQSYRNALEAGLDGRDGIRAGARMQALQPAVPASPK